MDPGHWLLLVSTAIVFYTLGVTWFAQIVVYPLFGKVGEQEYVAYHLFYSSRIPLPVIVPGFATFLVPVPLVLLGPESVPMSLYVANVVCGAVGLLVTVGLEIPRHSRLEKGGKQEKVIRELVRYNWPRTLSISASAVLTLLMLVAAFSPT